MNRWIEVRLSALVAGALLFFIFGALIGSILTERFVSKPEHAQEQHR